MTCVVGLVDDTGMYMGADSLASSEVHKESRGDQKVFKIQDYLIGFAASYRMGQVLRYYFTPPQVSHGMDQMEHMVTRFVPSVIKTLIECGYSMNDNGGSFLVAHRQKLFKIEADYQVGEMTDKYCAIGCGYKEALGSLHTTHLYRHTARQKIHLALSASEKFNPGVRGPFYMVDHQLPQIDSVDIEI